MNFAQRYEYFSRPERGGSVHPLFLTLAAFHYPDAVDEELEVLAQQFIPPDHALVVACEEIKADAAAENGSAA